MIKVYPHNTLLNIACYHCCNVAKKNNSKNKAGMTLDCYSCLIFLAFSVEAIINYVGDKKIDNWIDDYEHKPYHKKMHILSKKLGFMVDDEEPYRVLQTLKEIRNEMAHGKPIENNTSIKSEKHLNMKMRLWSEYATPEYIDNALRQVLLFQNIVGERIEYDDPTDWALKGGDFAWGAMPFDPDKPIKGTTVNY